MQIIEQCKGTKISYRIEGTKIIFDEKLEVDLEAEQNDVQKIVDISLNKEGQLVKGLDEWYIANIVIPPREYEYSTNENGEQTITALPVNMDKVVLVLWALPEGGR